jgi:hypothetical protein
VASWKVGCGLLLVFLVNDAQTLSDLASDNAASPGPDFAHMVENSGNVVICTKPNANI